MSARSGIVGKHIPAPFGAIPGHFSMGRKNQKNAKTNMPIFLGGPMGPVHPVWVLAAIIDIWNVLGLGMCRLASGAFGSLSQ